MRLSMRVCGVQLCHLARASLPLDTSLPLDLRLFACSHVCVDDASLIAHLNTKVIKDECLFMKHFVKGVFSLNELHVADGATLRCSSRLLSGSESVRLIIVYLRSLRFILVKVSGSGSLSH